MTSIYNFGLTFMLGEFRIFLQARKSTPPATSWEEERNYYQSVQCFRTDLERKDPNSTEFLCRDISHNKKLVTFAWKLFGNTCSSRSFCDSALYQRIQCFVKPRYVMNFDRLFFSRVSYCWSIVGLRVLWRNDSYRVRVLLWQNTSNTSCKAFSKTRLKRIYVLA